MTVAMEKQEIRERLRNLVEDFAGGHPSVFAKRVGITHSRMLAYIHGQGLPSLQNLARICCATGVTPNWLIFGHRPKYEWEAKMSALAVCKSDERTAQTTDEFVAVPIVQAIADQETEMSVLKRLVFGDDMIITRQREGATLCAIRMPDESMKGEIAEGDVVVVDLEQGGDNLSDSGCEALLEDDCITVRRVVNGIGYANDPSRYPPAPVPAKDILGHALELHRLQLTQPPR